MGERKKSKGNDVKLIQDKTAYPESEDKINF